MILRSMARGGDCATHSERLSFNLETVSHAHLLVCVARKLMYTELSFLTNNRPDILVAAAHHACPIRCYGIDGTFPPRQRACARACAPLTRHSYAGWLAFQKAKPLPTRSCPVRRLPELHCRRCLIQLNPATRPKQRCRSRQTPLPRLPLHFLALWSEGDTQPVGCAGPPRCSSTNMPRTLLARL